MSGQTSKAKKFDVIIVGAGPLGWASAQLLARHAIKTALVDPSLDAACPQWLESGLGVLWPSLNDPPTRALIAHGKPMAFWLQDFCARGVAVGQKLLGNENLIHTPSLRLALESHEAAEIKAAIAAGFALTPAPHFGSAFYKEQHPAAIFKSPLAHAESIFLNKKISPIQGRVTAVEETHNEVRVLLADGSSLISEMVLLANGYKISDLVPWLKPMLVPMSDVKSVWETNIPALSDATPLAIRMASGHVAALLIPSLSSSASTTWQLRLTGPRFLLPQSGAGIDLTAQPLDEKLALKIETWIRTRLLPHLLPLLCEMSAVTHSIPAPETVVLRRLDLHLGVDCLPCDELPVLGEMGHHGRLLGATGWLACGWSAGFQAAHVLLELIQKGSSPQLKQLLRPLRWRSGLEDGVTGMT